MSAKRKGNNQIAMLLLLGGAFLLYQKSQQPKYSPQFSNVPPAPSQNNQAQYMMWVKLVTDTYGTISDLWKPGGPFYKEPVPKYDAGSIFWQDVSNIAGIPQRFKTRSL